MASLGWLLGQGDASANLRVAVNGLPEHLRITIGTETEVKAVQESLARFVAAK